MTKIDNPTRGEFEQLKREIRALQTQSPLESSSVSNGRVRFIGGLLRVDSGGRVEIVGSFSIDGTTTVSGTFTVDGPWEINGNGSITGALGITGPTQIDGPTTINGNFWVNGYTRISAGLEINGPWSLNGDGTIVGDADMTGDMLVRSGGKIRVQGGGGDVVLDSSFGVPRINLGVAQIEAGASSFTFTVGTQTVYFLDNTIRIPGMPTRPVSDFPGGFAGAIVSDLAGKFYRLA